MWYVLLVIPHVIALAGLFAFAYYSTRSPGIEEGGEGFGGDDGGQSAPRPPRSGPSGGGAPLLEAVPPRRRLRAGERLADLHPRPARREREPVPHRAPVAP